MDYQETIRRFPTEAPINANAPGQGGAARSGNNNRPDLNTAPKVVCLSWRPYERNTLKGFAEIEVRSWRLVVADVAIHSKDGKWWAQLPAKPLIKKETGELMRQGDGRPAYARVVWFNDRNVADRFSAAVIDAVKAKAGAI